jgi:ABC-type branched-subunit amino acid transport system substrate-binding protein
MKGKKFSLLLGIVCLVLVVALTFTVACPSPTPTTAPPTTAPPTTTPPTTTAAPKVFKLGILDGLSGQFSDMTGMIYDGKMLAIDMLNEQGGIVVNGEQYLIEGVVEDNKNTAEGAVAGATRLIEDAKVKFICGANMTWVVNAEASVTDPAGVFRCNTWNNATSTEFSAATPYTLESSWGTLESTKACVDFLVKNYPEAKSVLIIMPDDGGIPEVFPKQKKVCEDAGLTVTGDCLPWAMDTVDYYPIAQKAIERNADVWLLNPAWETIVASFLKAGREQGFDGLMTNGQGCFYILQEVSGGDPDVLTNCFFPGFSTPTVEDLRALPDDVFGSMPMVKEVGEKAFAKNNFFHSFNLMGFNGVWNLVKIIEQAQSFDPAVVAAYIDTMDTMETVYGTATMCGLETFGIKHALTGMAPIQVIEHGVMRYAGPADMYLP